LRALRRSGTAERTQAYWRTGSLLARWDGCAAALTHRLASVVIWCRRAEFGKDFRRWRESVTPLLYTGFEGNSERSGEAAGL